MKNGPLLLRADPKHLWNSGMTSDRRREDAGYCRPASGEDRQPGRCSHRLRQQGKTLISSRAGQGPGEGAMQLDYKALGLSPEKTHLYAKLQAFQTMPSSVPVRDPVSPARWLLSR